MLYVQIRWTRYANPYQEEVATMGWPTFNGVNWSEWSECFTYKFRRDDYASSVLQGAPNQWMSQQDLDTMEASLYDLVMKIIDDKIAAKVEQWVKVKLAPAERKGSKVFSLLKDYDETDHQWQEYVQQLKQLEEKQISISNDDSSHYSHVSCSSDTSSTQTSDDKKAAIRERYKRLDRCVQEVGQSLSDFGDRICQYYGRAANEGVFHQEHTKVSSYIEGLCSVTDTQRAKTLLDKDKIFTLVDLATEMTFHESHPE